MFAGAVANDAVVGPAVARKVVDTVGVEAVVETMVARSGGRSEPEIAENAWCVATLSGAIAKSK